MKKMIFILVGLLLLAPIFLMGCEKHNDVLSYSIDCTYDDLEHKLFSKQSVNYFNTSNNILESVEFFLYPNSMKECAVPTSYADKAYPNGESFGDIQILSAAVNSQNVEFNLKNDAILVVPLGFELYPDEGVLIELDYIVTLANINSRLGYGENTINFGNFFPIVCVYENGFVENDFSKNGDPFYSEIADFDVKITYNSKYKIATSGEIVESKNEENTSKIQVKGKKLRDFCFVLSEKFEKVCDVANNIEVNYYYFSDENYEENLQVAVSVVKDFCEMFGDYPYKSVNVVQADFCFGGMEYPNLVYIAGHISDKQTYQYVIVHELAHQWWYSVVGNNEYQEAWVDESLTEYSTMLFFEKHKELGYDYDTLIKNAKDSYLTFVQVYKSVQGQVDESMNRALCDFATEPEYVNCVYTKGVLMYDSIRELVGDNKFFRCLKDYYSDFSFKIAHGSDLIKSFSKTCRTDLEGCFEAWLCGTVIISG